jgi:hypothetical protein
MATESIPLSLEACHQCGLPSLTFDDIDLPMPSPVPEDEATDSHSHEEPRLEAFLPAANF